MVRVNARLLLQSYPRRFRPRPVRRLYMLARPRLLPLPTTHWPSNGDYGDVLIRLPEAFKTRNQTFDLETCKINLAIVEALIKKEDVNIPTTDETLYQVDLDKDGDLATAEKIVYNWAPLEGRDMEYVGDANAQLAAGSLSGLGTSPTGQPSG